MGHTKPLWRFENDYKKKKNKQNNNLSSLAYNRCSRIYARSATNH